MAVLFSGNAGLVKIVNLGNSVNVGSLKISSSGTNLVGRAGVLVTGISEDQQVSAQLVTSLEKDVYIYSFGDQVGDVTISGLLLDRLCVQSSSPVSSRGETTKRWTGVESLAKFYQKGRAIAENRKVTIILGPRTIQGYLMRMGHSTANPELKTQSFLLNIKTIPDD
jgi:hypothetical protein